MTKAPKGQPRWHPISALRCPTSPGSAKTSWRGRPSGTCAPRPSAKPTPSWSTDTTENPWPNSWAAEPCRPPTASGSPSGVNRSPPGPCRGTSSTRAPPPSPTSPTTTPPTAPKVIPSTVPEASSTLDEILGNPTDLPIAEHTVDTAGQTLALFAAFDLVGLRFSPRIRDLPSRRLYRLGPAKDLSAYPNAGPLLRQRINQDLIVSQWDELLRLGGSLKFGHATASLLLAKLQTGSRHNALARGLLEYGRLIRTLFILRYLADPELQRRVHRQLNKGESLHALRRRILYANEGHIRRRHHDAQTEQALCLTLVTNAVVLFNTVYLQDALDALLAEGHPVTDDNAAHLSPALSDHINIHGSLTFDVERELARTGHRPLRSPTSR